MAENKSSHRANGAEEKNNAKDIAEILKMLRDSVGKPVEEKPAEKLDDQIEEQLRDTLNDADQRKAESIAEDDPVEVEEIETDEDDAPW